MREEPVDACCVTTGGKLRYRYIGRVLHSYPYNSLFAALSCSCSRAYGESAQHPEACGQAFCGSRSTESMLCNAAVRRLASQACCMHVSFRRQSGPPLTCHQPAPDCLELRTMTSAGA
jgi:hypothetical protein